jgi:hypothetical protein
MYQHHVRQGEGRLAGFERFEADRSDRPGTVHTGRSLPKCNASEAYRPVLDGWLTADGFASALGKERCSLNRDHPEQARIDGQDEVEPSEIADVRYLDGDVNLILELGQLVRRWHCAEKGSIVLCPPALNRKAYAECRR